MSVNIQPMTAEDLFMMRDDGYRYELVKGELKKMTPAGSKHGNITIKLGAALAHYVEANDLGEVFGPDTGFKLAEAPDTVRAPDVTFVRKERIPAGELTEKFWPGAPDLAVEVISPSDTLYELDQKIEDYLAAGVKAVWIVNPRKRTVTVYRPKAAPQTLTEKEVLDGQDIVPGFQYSLAKLFARRSL